MRFRWKIVLAFLLGTVFAELSSDPADYIAIQRFTQAGLSSQEAIFYWYGLTASVYAVLFCVAYILATYTTAKPVHFVYFLIFLVLLGAYQSYRVIMAGTPSISTWGLLAVATMTSLAILMGLKGKVE